MNYSERHKEFASYLNGYYNINEQDVLDHPENYLGPNYKEVLNLWFYWYSLSSEQCDVYWNVYWNRVGSLDVETNYKSHSTAEELAKQVIDPRFVEHIGIGELELIVAHLYIERGIPFTYLPLYIDL
jgi:hypothetical protein